MQGWGLQIRANKIQNKNQSEEMGEAQSTRTSKLDPTSCDLVDQPQGSVSLSSSGLDLECQKSVLDTNLDTAGRVSHPHPFSSLFLDLWKCEDTEYRSGTHLFDS